MTFILPHNTITYLFSLLPDPLLGVGPAFLQFILKLDGRLWNRFLPGYTLPPEVLPDELPQLYHTKGHSILLYSVFGKCLLLQSSLFLSAPVRFSSFSRLPHPNHGGNPFQERGCSHSVSTYAVGSLLFQLGRMALTERPGCLLPDPICYFGCLQLEVFTECLPALQVSSYISLPYPAGEYMGDFFTN